MPGVDWIPGVSQVKSFCQLVTGDVEGAARTQENFAKECPVVSQVTSVVQVIAGDADGAVETQKRCLGTINNVANGIPVVGHIKGGVHHVFGDHEGGNQALNAATRSTVVIGSGVAAGFASGGIAAIPAGIAAGTAYDLTDTAISGAINGAVKPKGVFAVVDNAINNPNAGNIFDAAAVFAGDGLAGYSGGQIGKQIATRVKLNSLEATRAAKYEKLDAGMFPEEGAIAMESGEAATLGQQINALTSEIHTIRHGTPQYWWDPKTNQIVVEHTGGLHNNYTVVGNVYSNSGSLQENGLQSDCYVGEIEVALNPEQRKEKKKEYVRQKEREETLIQAYPTTTVVSNNEWQELINYLDRDNDPSKNITKKMLELFVKLMWLHVQMPSQFGYTGAILTNDPIQGLLHTFQRHWDQWQQYVPGINNLMQRLPDNILQLLKKIQNAKNKYAATNAINKLNEAIKNLSNETYVVVRGTLFEIQVKILEFLKKNITSVQYLEEGVNQNGLIQVYFKVTDSSGRTGVMVVCVSEQLYPRIPDFGDPRPVRTITTVFFKAWDEYMRSEIRTGKGWP